MTPVWVAPVNVATIAPLPLSAGRPRDQHAATQGSIMVATRRSMAAGLAASSLFPARGQADDASARAFLDNIYAHYDGRQGSGGVKLDSDVAVRRLFDPPLATLILADQDQAARQNEPPALDGDPFVDAQDWVIRDLQITILASSTSDASAEISFTNLGHQVRLGIALVRLANGWRVHEITYATTTLSRIISER
jgi:hypothetical protein